MKSSPDGTRIPAIVWQSSDSNVVKVNDKGEITGKGYYSGKTVKTFSIVSAKASLKSVRAGKEKISLRISGQKGGVSYQIAYKKSGSGSWKTVSTSKTSYTLKSLKKGKKYYGAWSKAGSVRTK